MPMGIALGIAIGTAIGVATDDLAVWMSVGVALGAGISTACLPRKKNQSTKKVEQ